jgi:ATP-dependent RNA helicase DeaD
MTGELEAGSLDASHGAAAEAARDDAQETEQKNAQQNAQETEPQNAPETQPSDEPQTFDEMQLHPEVKQSLLEMGFLDPMPVQRACYRRLMAGKDLMVQSRTGSGKTAAFGIPFAQGLIAPEQKQVQALVLAPTRELALQVAQECGRIGQYRGLAVVPVYGGAPMGKQIEALKAGSQIVAGTPGRVLDHLRRGTLKLDALKVLVLDEADEMLSMGFLEEITEIIKRCPTERQTILFSATIPDDIERIGSRYMRGPEKVHLSRDGVGVREIKHAYYMVSGMGRARDLVRVLSVERPESAIIFCNTREDTALVAEHLRKAGLDAEAISSDLTQRDRERVMGRSKDKNLKYLVATDIAARGIDITDLSHVINYTFPESPEVYVHRTGRTGRAGKSGVAISLISPRELGNFYMLKLTYKIKPEERTLPSEEQLKSSHESARVDELKAKLGERTASDEWKAVAKRLWSSEDGERLVAVLIKDALSESRPPRAETAIPQGPRGGDDSSAITDGGGASAAGGAPSASAGAAPLPVGDRGRREQREGRGPDRGDRGERGGERDSRRARGRRGSGRDRERERPAPRGERPDKKIAETIDTSDGREFWEAWVDSKTDAAAPSASVAAGAPGVEASSVITEEAAARPLERTGERGERERERAIEVPPGRVRLYLNLGRRDGAREPEVQALLAERGLSVEALQVRNSHTYLIVPEEAEATVCTTLTGHKYGDRDLVCERARK